MKRAIPNKGLVKILISINYLDVLNPEFIIPDIQDLVG